MATAFFRTVILYLLLIAGLRITGKRQIGELEPIELVLTMLLSDLASVPMQDFGIPLVNGIAPMVRILSKNTGYKLKEVYELFPSGPGKGACKMAGLPKPTGCV